MKGAIDDLVDVRQDDMSWVHAAVGQEADLFRATGPVLAVGEDRNARPAVGVGRGGKRALIANGGASLATGHLDRAGPMLGSTDDRAAVVALVDSIGHVGSEEICELRLAGSLRPVARGVVAGVMQTRRGDRLDACPSGDLGQLADIPPGVGRHRVDDAAETHGDGRRELGGHERDIVEPKIGEHLDRPPTVDHEVFVAVGHAKRRRVDVAVDGSNERHVRPSRRPSSANRPSRRHAPNGT